MNRWSRRSALKIRSSNTLIGRASGLHQESRKFSENISKWQSISYFPSWLLQTFTPPLCQKTQQYFTHLWHRWWYILYRHAAQAVRLINTLLGFFDYIPSRFISCSQSHILTHTQWTSPWILMRTHDVVMFYGHTEKMCCWGSRKCHLNAETLKLSSILSSPPFLSGLDS